MEYWKASEDVQKIATDLIGKYHPDLATISDDIVVVFREKAATRGGNVIYGTARRVSAMSNALANENYKFSLEVGADKWEHELTSRQREALLDELLCACRAEEDPESGEAKLSLAPPDRLIYSENFDRYGMWRPKTDSEKASEVDDKLIEELS